MINIAFVSTYVPQRCGLATYTHHLRSAIRAAQGWKSSDPVVKLTQTGGDEPHVDALIWPLRKDDRRSYAKMAEKLNASKVSVVSLQHEFGIFGGEAGAYVLDFVRALKKPLVTTFHTVFEHPKEPYLSIQRELAERSDRIVVMNRAGVGFVRSSFGLPEHRVVFIPHGTPEPSAVSREELRQSFGWSGKKVIMTFGLLGRGKGIESIIRAMPDVLKRVPEAVYVIVGQTHPEVKKREGESYREELRQLAASLGVEQQVVMIDRYVEESELVRYLRAADLYVTPYPGMEQITSGTLAYAVGLGRPVLSTPYRYAKDLLEGFEEALIPYGDTERWSRTMADVLSNPALQEEWAQRSERIGATMRWPTVAEAYLRTLREAAAESRGPAKEEGGGRLAIGNA